MSSSGKKSYPRLEFGIRCLMTIPASIITLTKKLRRRSGMSRNLRLLKYGQCRRMRNSIPGLQGRIFFEISATFIIYAESTPLWTYIYQLNVDILCNHHHIKVFVRVRTKFYKISMKRVSSRGV